MARVHPIYALCYVHCILLIVTLCTCTAHCTCLIYGFWDHPQPHLQKLTNIQCCHHLLTCSVSFYFAVKWTFCTTSLWPCRNQIKHRADLLSDMCLFLCSHSLHAWTDRYNFFPKLSPIKTGKTDFITAWRWRNSTDLRGSLNFSNWRVWKLSYFLA